jgi:hypothetical protein
LKAPLPRRIAFVKAEAPDYRTTRRPFGEWAPFSGQIAQSKLLECDLIAPRGAKQGAMVG